MLLLKLPWATHEPISWLTALFTSTSTTTVTGLFTINNVTTFTAFGDFIILILIQLGGLGVMTFASLMLLLMEKTITIKQRLMIQEALNQSSLGGIMKLARRLFFFSMFFEVFFACILGVHLIPRLGVMKGLGYAIFHSVSAFNNSGISLWSDSLMGFVGDPIMNVAISLLFMLGGIGFSVMNDVWDKKKWRELNLHTKVMLTGTLIVNCIAILLFLALEYDNVHTLGQLSIHDRLWAGYFQGVVPRTAGFNTIDITQLRPETQFLLMALMFIGAGSVSTGGGIKLSTFLCLVMMIISYIRKQKEPTIMRRSISVSDIFKALTISLISMGVILVAIFILLITEGHAFDFLQIAFEAVSSFSTTGLSNGITPHLSVVGQCVIMCLMIFGKLGPLTIVFSVASRSNDLIRYPNGKLFIG
nr:TrkH family potassium uptake protein [Pullulanibacillus pueri]